MVIAFVHNGKALLPEIEAYRRFFGAIGIETMVCAAGSEQAATADVLWYFMGLYRGPRPAGKLVIHEYCSASIPPFRRLKDLVKSRLNPTPDFRLFQNEFVLEQIRPGDEAPYGFRDHGADVAQPPLLSETGKKYDFIYCGSCSPARKLDPLLDCFATGSLKDRKLLLLGNDYKKLQGRFSRNGNIFFYGPVPPGEVGGYLAQAAFAINYMPAGLPFTAQTSGKFLDYAAAGLPIVSSRYDWVLRFEERFGGRYYYLKPDLSNFGWGRVNEFRYEQPDLRSWGWDEQIRRSGVLAFLQMKFPELVLL